MNMLENLLTIALVKSASLSTHKIQNLAVIVISSSIKAEDTGMLYTFFKFCICYGLILLS